MNATTQQVTYEENYHKQRHQDHYKKSYYEARAKVALTKFFKNVDPAQRILDDGCSLGQNILFLKKRNRL